MDDARICFSRAVLRASLMTVPVLYADLFRYFVRLQLSAEIGRFVSTLSAKHCGVEKIAKIANRLTAIELCVPLREYTSKHSGDMLATSRKLKYLIGPYAYCLGQEFRAYVGTGYRFHNKTVSACLTPTADKEYRHNGNTGVRAAYTWPSASRRAYNEIYGLLALFQEGGPLHTPERWHWCTDEKSRTGQDVR